MADKLKQCPFCGGEVELVKQKSDEFEFVLVSCKNCDATIGIGGSDNEQKVTEAWDNRPSPWHTGTPTEEGLYAVYFLDDHNPSATPYEVLYDGFLSPDGEGNWIDRDGEIRFIDDDIVRWHKIEKED